MKRRGAPSPETDLAQGMRILAKQPLQPKVPLASSVALGPVIVATDGTSASTKAVQWSAWIARTVGTTLTAVSVGIPRTDEREKAHDSTLLFETGTRAAQSSLDYAREIAKASGLPNLRMTAVEGQVVPCVLDAIRESKSALLVVGEGQRDKLAFPGLGSTARQLLQQAPCSVLVARGTPPPSKLLVPIDGSAGSESAAATAYQLSHRSSLDMTVYHVASPPPRPPKPSFETETVWSHGPPMVQFRADAGRAAPHILEFSSANRFDLIVLGSKGLTNSAGWSPGGISTTVALQAPTSVLIVKGAP